MSVFASPIALDRYLVAGAAGFPVQVRHGDDSWSELARIAADPAPDAFVIVTERTLPRAHIARVLHHLGTAAPTCVRWLTGQDVPDGAALTPGSVIVALGGTRVIDAAGRLAARTGGHPRLVYLPTTLRAMSDSALSLVGPTGPRPAPVLVRVQLDFLTTLTPEAVRSGLSALVRNVLAVSPAFHDRVADRLRPDARYDLETLASFIALSLEVRATLMIYDPLERGPAMAFHYGRTVANALRGLGADAPRYGEATALGMLVAARVARLSGLLDEEGERAHRELVARWGVPMELPATVTADDVLGALRRGATPGMPSPRRTASPGRPALVLLDRLGEPHIESGQPATEVGEDLLRAGLDAIAGRGARTPRPTGAATEGSPAGRDLAAATGPGRP
ncbi:3-dehydroquinate synthase family protein [Streptomyces syringium]|uniref:3-dehydroquinate synthase family protein n=1 Tax=Streptomyces syringium TaxID=76729 RepID=UPI00343A3B03